MALKFISAEEAASLVKHNDNVGFSGLPCRLPKSCTVAIAKLAEEEHAKGNSFKIGDLVLQQVILSMAH